MPSKRLGVSQKLSLLASGKSHTDAARAYGFSKQVVGYIVKNRDSLDKRIYQKIFKSCSEME